MDPKTQQTILTIVGAILFFGLMAWMKGCKDDNGEGPFEPTAGPGPQQEQIAAENVRFGH